MKYYDMETSDVLNKLESSNDGLSKEEAKYRLRTNGQNKLAEAQKESKLSKFLNEFKDMMIVILLISSVISFIISLINHESFVDSIVIIAIVIINAIMGFLQEMKADKALESLKKMQITKCKVKRDGLLVEINSEDIVVGDILVLEAGNTVPADARILTAISLQVDESSLTGESVAVEKTDKKLDGEEIALSERVNMIYSGTSIVYGKCTAVVTGTGMNTEIGVIAEYLTKEVKEVTPLEQKINGISKFLSVVILIIITIMFILGLTRNLGFTEILLLSISLAVAAIPEGLPAVITITLSLGVSNMAKKNAIIRKMSSVETLGCTEVICSDKTGTITQNKMTVKELVINNEIVKPSDLSNDDMLLSIMALNSDATKTEDTFIGDPTEIALYETCCLYMDVIKYNKDHERVDEIPFDSERKMMSTVNKFDDKLMMLTKGSFDSVIEACSKIVKNGKVIKLDDKMKEELRKLESEESNKAFRVLAYAYKELPNKYKIDKSLENDLIFAGMTSMIDPPRESVKESIELCKKAGIKPIMITGDSLMTASAIAREIGILENDDEAITGMELDKLTESELVEAVKKYTVYARVSPYNKLSIVNAWKKNNVVVAMTGDGVNDAPALKTANIGVGMGITGTEVSKGVSDVILSDDSFSTIVTAVEEGRRIFDNIRNVLVYLLAGNITEILVVFFGMLFGVEIFFPIQLLYINLITDSIPAIALSFESAAADVMERKVRKKDSAFFTPFLYAKLAISSILKTCAILSIYFIGLKLYNVEAGMTMAFLTIVLLEMIFAYSCRNIKKPVISNGLFNNHQLNRSMLLLLVLQILVFVTPLRNIFNIITLSGIQIIFCMIIVLIIFLLDELTKKVVADLFKDE